MSARHSGIVCSLGQSQTGAAFRPAKHHMFRLARAVRKAVQPSLFETDGTHIAPLRAAWRDLVEVRLPARAAQEAAQGKAWPVDQDHCFARILLDAVCERPWREVIRPPAWRNTPQDQLEQAIRLGEAVLNGQADIHALNVNSLRLRGKT